MGWDGGGRENLAKETELCREVGMVVVGGEDLGTAGGMGAAWRARERARTAAETGVGARAVALEMGIRRGSPPPAGRRHGELGFGAVFGDSSRG